MFSRNRGWSHFRESRGLRSKQAWATVILVIVVFAWLLLPSREHLPDFRGFEAGPERKQAFLEYLLPHIEDANEQILETRERISQLHEKWKKRGTLAGRHRRWLFAQADKCDLDPPNDGRLSEQFFTYLLTKVDVIPPSLALSQAALESGWGTSRFARQGNNLFGTWCYEPGCGLVPKRRSAGATHEVRVYDSPSESFLDYIWNLNSNSAYREMRRIRRVARLSNRPVLGVELALGLVRYSQEGHAYISKVTTVIRRNDLGGYDT